MAYASPSTRTTGDLITAAIWNQDIVANSQASVPDIFTTAGDTVYGTAADTATRLAIGSAFQTYRTNSGATAPEWAGGLSLISDSQLGGSAANIDFTSISSSYKHLVLFLSFRSDTAATSTATKIRFNNDSTSNYYTQLDVASGASATSGEGIAASSCDLGSMPAASATANFFSKVMVFVPDYTHATNRPGFTAISGFALGTSSGNVTAYNAYGFLNIAGAVSRVTLFAGAGSLVSGSRATLYGLT